MGPERPVAQPKVVIEPTKQKEKKPPLNAAAKGGFLSVATGTPKRNTFLGN